jgi:hypothetical protein
MMNKAGSLSNKATSKTLHIIALALLFITALLVAGCSPGLNTFGGGPNPTPTPTPTPSARLLISDNTTGAVNVVDAKTDLITHTIATNSPGKMVSAGGTALIQSTLASSVAVFDNASEAIRFTVPLSGLPLDVAITPDGKTGFVAVNDGTVQKINTATGTISGNFAVAGVQRLVMGPQGTTVLAFNDTLAINFTVVLSTGPVTLGNLALDHPANGFFTTDDNHFQVLDCGLECAGTQAGVAGVALNIPGGPLIANPIAVSGATVGLQSGNTILVAGSPANGFNAGTLQGIDTSTNGVSAALHIADGRHGLMALTSNGRLYIGATGCTLGTVNPQNLRQGCLTIFDTTTLAVTPVLLPAGRPNGDATGLTPVAGRNVIYVVQGGTVDIFDITTNAVSTSATPPSIPGTALGVVQLSP